MELRFEAYCEVVEFIGIYVDFYEYIYIYLRRQISKLSL